MVLQQHSRNAKKYYSKNAKEVAAPKGPNKGVNKGVNKGPTNKSGNTEPETTAKSKGAKPVKKTAKGKSKSR